MNAARALSGDLKAERHQYRTQLPDYTRGEEIMNMVTHIVGAAFAIAAIPVLIVAAAQHQNPWAIVSGAIFAIS